MGLDYIREKAKQLGLDPGSSSNHEDNLRTIAKQLGLDYDFTDLNEIESILDEMLIIKQREDALNNLADGIEELLDEPLVEEVVEEQEEDQNNYSRRNESEDSEDTEETTEGDSDNSNDENKQNDEGVDNKESNESSDSVESKDKTENKDLSEKPQSENEPASKKGKDGDIPNKEEGLPETKGQKNWNDKPKATKETVQKNPNSLQNKFNNVQNKMQNLKNSGSNLKQGLGDTAKKLGGKALDAGKTAGKAVGDGAKAAGQAIGKGISALGAKLAAAIASNPYLAAAIIVIALIALILLLIFASYSDDTEYIGLNGYDYIEPKCTEITIKGGEYAGVYDIEEYIAGVVYAEYGGFANEKQREAAKAGAVAARSYVLANVGDNCTVESSQNFQVYKTPTEATKLIAQETRGLVLVDSGRIKSTQYDAFCTKVPQDDPDYYVVCQKDQKIPRTWVDSQGGKILDSWKAGNMSGAHGNGMSQWGAAYLAEAEGYTFKDLLAYYYDTSEIMSIYKSFGYNGEYPIDPKNSFYNNLAFLTDQSFESFLTARGSSIEEYNNYLTAEITEAGIGTRDGVVSTAVTLIGSLAEMGIKINYQWAGKYYNIGVNKNWGSPANTLCDDFANAGYDKNHCLTNYKWSGFDCSGFVNWALINGTQNTQVGIQRTETKGGISLSENSAVCKPGGVLVSEGHIVLVVAIDEENKNYIVAEATGSRVSLGIGGVKLSNYSFNKAGYVCKNLDEIYGEQE